MERSRLRYLHIASFDSASAGGKILMLLATAPRWSRVQALEKTRGSNMISELLKSLETLSSEDLSRLYRRLLQQYRHESDLLRRLLFGPR
jgi:hypothetical protein